MFFVSLHSSERKFAPAQYVNRQRFLSPYLHSLFVTRSSARATRTVFCSSFVRSSFVFCSSFLYLPVRLAPSFVRLLFVFSLSTRTARTVFCSFIFLSHFSVTTLPLLGRGLGRGYFLRSLFICLSCYDCLCGSYLPVVLRPRTVINFGVIGIIGTMVLVAHLLT